MKKLILVTIIACLMAGQLYAQVSKNGICPVMDGERVKEKFYVDYQNERVYLCCKSCVKAFKKHPEKYVGKLKQN